MWRLCIEDDEANRTVVNLVRKEYTIGRAEENAVRLTERNVSRRHAVLRRTGDKWMLEDLKSETGSFVNERRVEEAVAVEHRDKVRVGDYDITLLDSEKEAEEAALDKQTETVPASAESDRAGDRHDRLVVVEGPNPGTQYPLLDKKLLIGRGDECDLTLPDTSVSRVHASLSRDEHGRFHISDQKSSNGVRVNGMEITKIPLYAGDIVELGDVHLQFVPKGSRFDESALRPATASRPASSRPPASGKLWVGLGLLGIVGGVVWFGSQRNRAVEAPVAVQAAPTTSVEDALLTQADALLKTNDLDGALTLLRSVPADSTQRSGAQYRSLVNTWADLQFQNVETQTDPNEQKRLLEQIVAFEGMAEAKLAKAVDQLRALSTPADSSESGETAPSVVSPSALPAAPPTASPVHPPPPVAAVARPVAVTRPAARPVAPPPAVKPPPAPAPVVTVAPSPSPVAPLPSVAPSSAPSPAVSPAPAPNPAPSPIAPKPAPVAPAPSPAQAAPSPAPAPPVNSPPVINWPGTAP